MASTEHATGVRTWPGRIAFPHLLGGTLLAVTLTILLGVATKGAGAGLACAARWPLCDGGVLNLFPATVPSFFEWIHRVVAGLTGFLILGTAVAAWRRDVGPRVRQAATLGLVLLPVQVLLGRETVVSFTIPVLAAHFWVAFTIFASFAVATALTWRAALSPGRLRAAAAAAALLVPVQVLLHPPVVSSLTPVVQTLQYAVTLSTFALAVAVAVGARDHLDGAAGRLALALPALPPALVLASRHLYRPGTLAPAAYLLLTVALAGSLVAVAAGLHRRVAA